MCARIFFADKDKNDPINNNAKSLALVATFMAIIGLKIEDPSISIFISLAAIGLIVTGLTMQMKIFFNVGSNYKICNNEKSIHQKLMNQLISAEILENLLSELNSNEKEKEKVQKQITFKPKLIDKPAIVYNAVNGEERDYSYFNQPTFRREKVRTKKIKIEKDINETSHELLAPIRNNISITWVVDGHEYTYHSNDTINNIIQLSSDDLYFNDFAKNSYAYFDEDIVWKLAGDKVKYQNLKNAFYEGEVVASINKTGFTYRPDGENDWTYKLKVVHKKGTGHLSMMFKKVAEEKSVTEDGKVTVSKLYMPSR